MTEREFKKQEEGSAPIGCSPTRREEVLQVASDLPTIDAPSVLVGMGDLHDLGMGGLRLR